MNKTRARKYLQHFDFEALFIEELGWDVYDARLPVTINANAYTLQAVAEKRGFVVFVCAQPQIPAYADRRKVERVAAKSFQEHLIIFHDADHTQQIWQWVRREIGRPLAGREQTYYQGQPGESILQKLELIEFGFDEEDDLTLVDVTSRVRAAFNVERATKKFYERFKKERSAFEKFVQGIPDVEMGKWYVSVMLNRLMFVYFIQKKGFLDGDPDYLRNRLRAMQQRHGGDQFYSFYRYFLLRLFHEGLGQPNHDAELEALVGRVPYLNGGIFQEHQVEQQYPDIQISDDAFARIFDFFDQYQWHLDDRPLRDDREINPDVLGYIFEKYINQKQMGAYYTKEDITEYISKNTIIPFLFDQARQDVAIAFSGARSVWSLLAENPDKYIYPAVRKGVAEKLPPQIAAGIENVAQRGEWNTPTPDKYALPTEIWRETVARRQRYAEVRARMANGEISDVNDLITYNLDVQQFAQDVIEHCEGPETVRAFWKAINRVTVLDPTCGSGAFLFAALNILQPLYEACLARMRAFVAELGPEDHPQKFSDFKQALAQIDEHPNQDYFVLKSIVVNNLYGVDIMPEAVEIAKLRLFLKLTAQVSRVEEIEPLPDIDFNIRAGNTLVGFVDQAEVARAMQQTGSGQGKLMFGEDRDALAAITEKAADVDRLFTRFRQMQTAGALRDFDAADFVQTKQALQQRLAALEDELNRALARQYGVDPDRPQAYQKWLAGHQPFHWFTEFYGILQQGGFDVVVGNPPYVEYKRVISDYSIMEYKTEGCGNLYAFIVERSCNIVKNDGFTGLIVPISLTSAQRMRPLQELLFETSADLWLSNFGLRPASLFPGIMQRLTIYLSKHGYQGKVYTTDYVTWYAAERQTLFALLNYVQLKDLVQDYSIPKINNSIARSALQKVFAHERAWHTHRQFKGDYVTYYHNAGGYWVKTFNFKPYYRSLIDPNKKHTTISELNMPTRNLSLSYLALMNSNLFYFFWKSLTDARHVYPSDIAMFPIHLPLPSKILKRLDRLTEALMACYKINSSRITYGKSEVDQFKVAPCKNLMDQIDCIFATHFRFTDEELDFIINYDIKYRMGDELFNDDEEGDDE